ncbi:MAG: hypothetical protein U0353_21160 [Sandaracinus sp.]
MRPRSHIALRGLCAACVAWLAMGALASAQDASTGNGAEGGVTTDHGAAHTTAQTSTHSGPAPTSTSPDASTEPVIDPVTAPPPTTTHTTSSGAAAPTGRAADEEEEDEGDGRDIDWLWLEASGGVADVNLVAFQNQNFADVAAGASVFSQVHGTGPTVAVGAGMRFWWLAIGARATFSFYDPFHIGTLGAELTLRLPVPVVEPWIRAGFGYGWQGNATYQGSASSFQTSTYGWTFQAGVGLDIYLLNWLTVGASFGLDVLNMTRQRDPTATCMGVTDVCPSQNGDALGVQLKGIATLGLRF